MNKKLNIVVMLIAVLMSTCVANANEAWESINEELKKANPHFNEDLCEIIEEGNRVTSLTLVNTVDIKALTGLNNLTSLTLKAPRYDSCVVDYSPLLELEKLNHLTLERQWKLNDFKVIAELPALEKLVLTNIHSFQNLDGLDDCRTLKALVLERCNAVSNLKGIYKGNLVKLSVKKCRNLKTIKYIPVETLTELTLADCPVTDLESLQEAVRLVRVDFNLKNASYGALVELPELTDITLNGEKYSIDSLENSGGDEIEELSLSYKTLKPYLVEIKEGKTKSLGFLASDESGGTYVYTNQHTIKGSGALILSTKDGKTHTPSEYEFALNRDILRFKVSSEKALAFRTSAPGVGDTFSTANVSKKKQNIVGGSISGVGPIRLELSRTIWNTMFGAPIVDHDMNVIGIAAERTRGRRQDWTNEGSRFSKGRSYGHRFNDVKWISHDWSTYKNVAAYTKLVDKDLSAILEAIRDWFKAPKESMAEDSYSQKDLRSWIRAHKRFVRQYDSRSSMKDIDSLGSDFKISYKKLSKLCERRSKVLGKKAKEYHKKQFEYHAKELEKAGHWYEWYATEIEKFGYTIFNRTFK